MPAYLCYTKYLTLLIGMLCGSTVHAQLKTASIKGIIIDSASHETLEQASIAVFRFPGNEHIRYGVSGKNGFEIKRLAQGHYQLIVSYSGYHPDTSFIMIKKDTVYNIGEIKLRRSVGEMMEVVVRATIPLLVVKNDTLVFNTGAVKTLPNATVEDLLKKLPGVEVDREGNVTIQGKRVEKIYIDGKEFFLGDTKIATQNLTADMIERIEAYEHQSDRARFSGIREKSTTKDINLRLKKDKKKGLMGNVVVGAGTNNNYNGKATITKFKGDHWIAGSLTGSYLDTRSGDAGLLRQGLNASLNYRGPVSKDLQMVMNGETGNSKSEAGQSFMRETFLGDSSLVQQQSSVNGNRANFQRLRGEFTWTIDNLNTVVFSPSIDKSNREAVNTDRTSIFSKKGTDVSEVSNGNTMNRKTTEGLSVSNSIQWKRRFKKVGRTLFSTFSYLNDSRQEDGRLYSALDFFGNGDSKINNQQYVQDNRSSNVDVDIAYTEPIGKKQILNIGYALGSVTSVSDKQSFNYNELSGRYDARDSLTSNYLSNSSALHSFKAGYNYMGEKMQYQAGLMVSYSELNTNSRGLENNTIDQFMMNWSPSLSANYYIAQSKSLAIQYNGSNTMPTADMLQPVPDISNPYLIRLGNPNLKQQFSHSVSLNYMSTNTTTFNTLLMGVEGRVENNKLAEASLITEGGVQQLQFINVNGVYDARANIGYSFMLNKGKNGGVDITANMHHGRDMNIINGVQNVHRSFGYEQSARLNYRRGEQLFINTGAILNYTYATYSIGEDLTTRNLSQTYIAEVTYLLPWSVHIQSSFNLNRIGSQRNLPGRTIAIWNASVFRTVMRNRGEVKLEAFDLLNRNTGFVQTVGDNYIESRETNVQQRYFMLSFRYRFTMARREK